MPQPWCKCQSCLLSAPEGRSFSKVDFKIHQLRLQREQLAAQATAERDLFTHTVVDAGSELNNAPSAMWNSREHVQARIPSDSFSASTVSTVSSAASAVAESVRRLALSSRSSGSSSTDDLAGAFSSMGLTDPSYNTSQSPRIFDEIIHTFEDMSLADPQQPISSSDVETSPSPDNDASSLDNNASSSPIEPSSDPIQPPIESSPVNSRAYISRLSRDKRENNVHTTRALKILTDIEHSMQDCATELNGVPTDSVRQEVENIVSRSRQVVEKVTRSTPSIIALKEKVARRILHVQNRLIELDALQRPEVRASPVEQPNGKSSITTRTWSI